jgi:hypothetical protein
MTNKKEEGLLNRLKGNRAEFLVASCLSRRCYVRPVASGTDTGIDLYCEALELATCEPFLHFWVQVKSGGGISLHNSGAAFRFKCRDIEYWLRQPVPVYAFLVPEQTLTGAGTKAYVVDLARQKHARRIVDRMEGRDEVTLHSDLDIDVGGHDLDRFLEEVLKPDYVLRGAQSGTHSYWPQPQASYLRGGLVGICGPYAENFIEQIRRGASAVLRDLASERAPTDEMKRQMAVCAAVLEPFTLAATRQDLERQDYREWHYEDFIARGRWLHLSGEIPKGDEMLRRAIACVQDDDRFKAGHPDPVGLVGWIKSLIKDPAGRAT